MKKQIISWKYFVSYKYDDYLKNSGHLSERQQYSETPGSNNWKLFNFALSFVFDSK